MSFEPFRSVVIPRGKMGAGFDPNAPPDPAAGRETRTIILEGPAIDPAASSAGTSALQATTATLTPSAPAAASTASAPPRRTTVTRPGSVVQAAAPAPSTAPSTAPSAAPPPVAAPTSGLSGISERSEIFVVDCPVEIPAEPRAPHRETLPRGARPASGATPVAQRQYVVAYDGRLVGTYRCAKRIQNRTAYLKCAEQLVGQIEDFDPERIRLYRLSEVPVAEPIRHEELNESFHSFPRDDVPAPGA